MVTQITSPSAGFTGTGTTGLQFTDGEAYTSSPYDIAFYKAAGYGIGGAPPTTVDSRTVEEVRTGTVLTDTFPAAPPDGVDRIVQDDESYTWGPVGPGYLDYGWVPEAYRVGTPLRDAAVDPQPGDHLPPTNAGLADPHGPDVVSPEIPGSPRNQRAWQ